MFCRCVADFATLYLLHWEFRKNQGLDAEFYEDVSIGDVGALVERTVVREVFIVHVGGTRCVPSSTDNILKMHARI